MGKYGAKTKPTAQEAEAFIAAVADDKRRTEAHAVDALMRRVSGEQPIMWGPSIVGYGSYHYRYDSGHEGDAPRMGFSPRKAELVLYVLPAADDDEVAALLGRLGKHRTGKSCLYIRDLAEVDLAVLEEIAALNWRTMAKRYPA